jgi:hypothetical protein
VPLPPEARLAADAAPNVGAELAESMARWLLENEPRLLAQLSPEQRSQLERFAHGVVSLTGD